MADVVAVRIIDAVYAILAGLAGVAEVEVAPPGDPAAFPALHLFDNGEQVRRHDSWSVRAALDLSVIGYVSGDGAAALAGARNLDGDIIQALADSQLGGLAIQVNVGALTVEPVDLARVRVVAFRRQFSIDYSYRTADPAIVGG